MVQNDLEFMDLVMRYRKNAFYQDRYVLEKGEICVAIKTILLLRHGQYKNEPSEQLTPLGRKQAILAGKRFKVIKFDKFHFSTLPREHIIRFERAQICLSIWQKWNQSDIFNVGRWLGAGQPVVKHQQ